MEHILEALAQLHQIETTPIYRFIREESRNLPWGSTLVAISAQPTNELKAILLDLKKAGRSVALITIGGEEPVAEDGLSVYHVPDKLAWEVVREIGLKEV